jgi:hemoglobin
MPTDPEFREAVREHVEFGTKVATQNSHATTDAELHPLREVPRWTWAGDDEPTGVDANK